MPRARFDEHFAQSPIDVLESFPYTIDTVLQNGVYDQATSDSTHLVNTQSDFPSLSVFEFGMQSPWTVSGDDRHVPETFTRAHNHFSCGSVEDNITVGTEHTLYTSRDNVEIQDLNDFYVGHVLSPTDQPSQKTRVGSPNDRGIPRSPCHEPKDKENISGLVQCGWQGCTNSSFFGRDLSLWRHIKEKHIRPNAFRCPASKCKRAYGRMDKLNEHLRSHDDKKGQTGGEKIRPSMA